MPFMPKLWTGRHHSVPRQLVCAVQLPTSSPSTCILALTPCALFAIGLKVSIDRLHANTSGASLLSIIKLIIMSLIVYGLSVSLRLNPLYTIAAVICAAVPTARTAYILAGQYSCEESCSVDCLDDNSSVLALCAVRAINTHRCKIGAGGCPAIGGHSVIRECNAKQTVKPKGPDSHLRPGLTPHAELI